MKFRKLLALFVLPTALALSGCGGSSDDDGEEGGGEETPDVTYSVNIAAASSAEVQEQTSFSIRADVSGSASDSSDVSFTASWSITDAPAGFEMPLTVEDLDADNKSIIRFTTPDVDQDTNITISITAAISGQSDTQIEKDIVVTITANQEVVISGAVVDEPIPNAAVQIVIGETTYNVVADANGEYELSVEYPDPSVMTLVTASGAEGQEEVLFKSYLGTGTKLLEQSGDDGVLNKDENFWVNVTNVTTAEFVLVQDALADGEVIESEEDLQEAREELDEDEVLEVAAIIKVIVDNDDVDLPEGIDNVLDLVSDETATEEFVEELEEENPGIIEETIEDIETDGNLTEPDVATGGLVGDDGSVTLKDFEGNESETTVVLGESFTSENAIGVYDLLVEVTEEGVTEQEEIIVTIASGGEGTIDFGIDEDGDQDINQIEWIVSSEGYLTFTEFSPPEEGDNEEWYFTIVRIVDERGNAIIDVNTPEGQADAEDATVIGDFTKRPDVQADRAANLIGENGQVTLLEPNGQTEAYTATLGDKFNSTNAPGVYDFYFEYIEDDGTPMSDDGELIISPDGTGTLYFDVDETPSITWHISPQGYLQFTELDGETPDLFYWTLVNIVDDNYNTLISVFTPDGQVDSTDATILGEFTKRVDDHVVIETQDVPGTYLWAPEMRGGSTFTFNADGTGDVHWSPEEQEPMGHPGYDDTLTWTVNASGQIEVVLTAGDGSNEYDLYTLDSGTMDDGIMSLQTKETPEGTYQYAGAYAWTSIDAAEVSNALVGSYVLGSGNDYNVLTLLDNERYYVGHTMDDGTNPVSGEYGTYTWNDVSGEFQATIVDESDSDSGIGESPETWTISSNTLTIDEDNTANSGDEITLDKLIYTDGSIVGSWYLEESHSYNIITFLDDGRYFVTHTNNTESEEGCALLAVSGEYGSYTWDAVTGAFEVTIVGESDCMGGFSDETTGKITIHEDGYLEVDNGSDDEVDVIFTKIQ